MAVVGTDVVGADVVGAAVIGAAVVGAAVVGAAVVAGLVRSRFSSGLSPPGSLGRSPHGYCHLSYFGKEP